MSNQKFKVKALEIFQKVLGSIHEKAKNYYDEINHTNIKIPEIEESEVDKTPIHYLSPFDLKDLPWDLILDDQDKSILMNLTDFLIDSFQLNNKVSPLFFYRSLLQIVEQEEIHLNSTIEIDKFDKLLNLLKDKIRVEIENTHFLIFAIVGAYLDYGEICQIGGVEFMSPLDFRQKYSELISILETSPSNPITKIDFILHECEMIAQVKVKGKDKKISKIKCQELLKRSLILIRLAMPKCVHKIDFLGILGEEFVEERSFLTLTSSSGQESKINELSIERYSNILKGNLNLYHLVSPHQKADEWFTNIENILIKFYHDQKLSKLEGRIWTALYWFSEAVDETETNQSLIKYATCLEALFNAREGGISEQISEFTAYVVGQNSQEKMEIYQNIKKLYSLRSKLVHGSKIQEKDLESYLAYIMRVCDLSIKGMSYIANHPNFSGSNGYEKFINHLLQDYRFKN